MDQYVTGAAIKRLREKQNLTQADLAVILGVSDKAVSKWETGRGYPDITLLEPIAKALRISVIELLSGNDIINLNRSSNILKSELYVCPVCGNIIHSTGEAIVSCCGITVPPLEAEEKDEEHFISCEKTEDEYYVSVSHEMTREHHISFLAFVSSDKFDMVKLYPEGNAEARFRLQRPGLLYCYCNRHGLFKQRV
ncbi:MAG: helix-turn-helix domain-containing protein [Eubacteriales bacterium]|nr:helix-turn-helix domain-containing protein [Eubacteriales bacterium]